MSAPAVWPDAWGDEIRAACACCGQLTVREGDLVPCIVCSWVNDPQASSALLDEARRRWEAELQWARELVGSGDLGEFFVTGTRP